MWHVSETCGIGKAWANFNKKIEAGEIPDITKCPMNPMEMSNQPIEEKWKENFRRDFRCPVCIGVTMDSECQPIDCGECGGSTFNPDWDYKSAESFIENLLEQERKRMSDEVKKLGYSVGELDKYVKGDVKDAYHDGFMTAKDKVKAIINK